MLKLTRRESSPVPLEMEGIIPEAVQGKSIQEIAQLHVFHGNRKETLGHHFQIEIVQNNLADILFAGNTSNVKLIGARMKSGSIFVENSAGMHCGAHMSGGSIIIDSNAGDWLGAEMTGGTIEVRGDAGNQVGAAYRGSRRGMNGGMISIQGNAGDEVGLLMRRGVIAIGQSVGSYCGASMIAGTIVIGETAGPRVAAGMKRGTIVIAGKEPSWPPGVVYSCDYQPSYAAVLFRYLREQKLEYLPHVPGMFRVFRADLATGGRGEILHLASK